MGTGSPRCAGFPGRGGVSGASPPPHFLCVLEAGRSRAQAARGRVLGLFLFPDPLGHSASFAGRTSMFTFIGRCRFTVDVPSVVFWVFLLSFLSRSLRDSMPFLAMFAGAFSTNVCALRVFVRK